MSYLCSKPSIHWHLRERPNPICMWNRACSRNHPIWKIIEKIQNFKSLASLLVPLEARTSGVANATAATAAIRATKMAIFMFDVPGNEDFDRGL
jgi:hypothetical protein